MMRFRPLPVLTLAAVPALALLVALGVWQVQRLGWKTELIARIEAGVSGPATALSDIDPGTVAEALEWTRVHADGVFDHTSEVLVRGRDAEGYIGFRVVTPLQLGDGHVVFVDRGFVPPALAEPAARPEGLTAGPVRVEGFLRRERPNAFTPPPEAGGRIFYARDVAAIAASRGLDSRLKMFIEAATETPGHDGFPRPDPGRPHLRNPHLGYALTWFGLAIALVIVYAAVHRARGRL